MKQRRVVKYSKDGEKLETYGSIREAQNTYHISHVSSVCSGRRMTDGGFIWRYEGDAFDLPADQRSVRKYNEPVARRKEIM